MKALTVSQPFASLIACGEKFVENRTWHTSFRGPLLIHAGKGTQYLSRNELREYPTGCIVAVSRLVACVNVNTIRFNDTMPANRKFLVPGSTRNWSEVARHKHTEGPFCWIMDDVEEIHAPIVYRGAQGLWDVPEELMALIQVRTHEHGSQD